ncbi:MAG: hypothetical protein Tsb0032_15440 [Kiloniellaceae bacterium]
MPLPCGGTLGRRDMGRWSLSRGDRISGQSLAAGGTGREQVTLGAVGSVAEAGRLSMAPLGKTAQNRLTHRRLDATPLHYNRGLQINPLAQAPLRRSYRA